MQSSTRTSYNSTSLGEEPKKIIIICATMRSGSTFFAEALSASLGMGEQYIKEYFVPRELEIAKYESLLGQDCKLSEVIRAIKVRRQSSDGIFGAKIMYETLEYIFSVIREETPKLAKYSNRQLFEWLFPNASLIFVERKDKLKQAISYAKASQTEFWGNEHQRDTDVRFDYLEINSALNNFAKQESGWLSLFKELKVRPLEICYETLIADYNETMQGVFDYLGIPGEPIEQSLNPMEKRGGSINKEWYLQFQKIDAAIAGRRGPTPLLPVDALLAQLSHAALTDEVTSLSPFSVTLEIKNSSRVNWPAYGGEDGSSWIYLHSYWQKALKDGQRQLLHSNVSIPILKALDAGEAMTVRAILRPPENSGDYSVCWELKQSGSDILFDYVSDSSNLMAISVRLREEEQAAIDFFGPELKHCSENAKWHPVFGYMFVDSFPWVHQTKLGWICVGGGGFEQDDFCFYFDQLGWCRTTVKDYPEFDVLDDLGRRITLDVFNEDRMRYKYMDESIWRDYKAK